MPCGHKSPREHPGKDPRRGSQTGEVLAGPVVPTPNFGETFGGLWGSYTNFKEDVLFPFSFLGGFWGGSVIPIPSFGEVSEGIIPNFGETLGPPSPVLGRFLGVLRSPILQY